MIYLSEFIDTQDQGIKIVNYIHYMPFDSVNGLGKTQEELLENGILIDALPRVPDFGVGYIAVLKVDMAKNLIFYDKEVRELTVEENVRQLSEDTMLNMEIGVETNQAVLLTQEDGLVIMELLLDIQSKITPSV